MQLAVLTWPPNNGHRWKIQTCIARTIQLGLYKKTVRTENRSEPCQTEPVRSVSGKAGRVRLWKAQTQTSFSFGWSHDSRSLPPPLPLLLSPYSLRIISIQSIVVVISAPVAPLVFLRRIKPLLEGYMWAGVPPLWELWIVKIVSVRVAGVREGIVLLPLEWGQDWFFLLEIFAAVSADNL